MKKALIYIVVILAILGIGFWFMTLNKKVEEEGSFKIGDEHCPQDAKLCSNGSSVGRHGENCEFSVCEGEENELSQFFESRSLGVRIKHPSNWKVSGQTDTTTGKKEVYAKSGNSVLKISVFENKEKVFLKAWFDSSFEKSGNEDCEFSDSDIKIGKYYTKRIRLKAGLEEGECRETGLYANVDGNLMIVRAEVEEGNNNEAIRNILGSFEFIYN